MKRIRYNASVLSLILYLITVAASSFLLTGCLPIDYAPLDNREFYRSTKDYISSIKDRIKIDDGTDNLLAGAAKREITLPVGTPLAGYGKRKNKRSIGVHDPLYARAIALSDGRDRVIIIGSDLLAVTNEIYDAVYKKIRKRIPIEKRGLLISATHTHSGPGGLSKKFLEKFASGPFYQIAFDYITESMAEAAIDAYLNMSPSRIGRGSIKAHHLIKNRMDPGGIVDPEIRFLVIEGIDKENTIYLINFSAHPTILKSNNLMFSGGFPGFLEAYLEREKGVIALYTSGAVGDQTANPPPGINGFDRAERMGKELSDLVLKGTKDIEFEYKTDIISLLTRVDLPPTQVRVGSDYRLPSFMGDIFFDKSSSFQVLVIGKILLLGLPCDLSADIGIKIKQYAEEKGFFPIIIGFANDYIGYIISHTSYDTNAYEARMSFNGPYMDRYTEEIVYEMIDRVGGQGSGVRGQGSE